MNTVGVKQLKNRLTHYLRRTQLGEAVVVTEHGAPVALLRPIKKTKKDVSREAKLARLAARGAVTLPTAKPLARVRPVKVSGKPISKIIVEDRR